MYYLSASETIACFSTWQKRILFTFRVSYEEKEVKMAFYSQKTVAGSFENIRQRLIDSISSGKKGLAFNQKLMCRRLSKRN
jgi:hypothetical protein